MRCKIDDRFFEECIFLRVHRWVICINPDVNFRAKLCTMFYFCLNKGVGLVNPCSISFTQTIGFILQLFLFSISKKGGKMIILKEKKHIRKYIHRTFWRLPELQKLEPTINNVLLKIVSYFLIIEAFKIKYSSYFSIQSKEIHVHAILFFHSVFFFLYFSKQFDLEKKYFLKQFYFNKIKN